MIGPLSRLPIERPFPKMAKYFFSLAEEAHYSVVVKVTLQISHGLVIIFQR